MAQVGFKQPLRSLGFACDEAMQVVSEKVDLTFATLARDTREPVRNPLKPDDEPDELTLVALLKEQRHMRQSLEDWSRQQEKHLLAALEDLRGLPRSSSAASASTSPPHVMSGAV